LFQTTESSIPNLLSYVYLGVPVTTLTVFYFLVFKKIRKHQQNVRGTLQCSSTNENITSRDPLRSQRFSSSPSLAFWLVGLLLSSWTSRTRFVVKLYFKDRSTFFQYLVLAHLSAFINPIVYGFLNKNFREEYKRMISFMKRNNRVAVLAQSKRNTKTFVISLA